MDAKKELTFTVKDIEALPDKERAELIDGQIYFMASPTLEHQILSAELSYQIMDHIKKKGKDYRVLTAPFAVYLSDDDINYVEPDISVICDKNKLDDKGCHGAPDWIIEIVSPSSQRMDYAIKLFKYRSAGVREYWIVDMEKKQVTVHSFENEKFSQYSFEEVVPCRLDEEFTVKLNL